MFCTQDYTVKLLNPLKIDAVLYYRLQTLTCDCKEKNMFYGKY